MIMADYRSSGKELRKSPRGVIAGVFALILAAGVGYGAFLVHQNLVSLRPDPSVHSESDVIIPATETTAQANQQDYVTREFPVSDIKNGALILVNDLYSTEDNEERLAVAADQRNEHLSVRDRNIRLREDAMDAVNQLAVGFYKATEHSDLMILNAYRTKAAQKKLYENSLKKAKNNEPPAYSLPGCSDYQTGYTLDFCINKKGKYSDFTGEGDYAWVAEHCAEYGFVRRYPPEKASVVAPTDKGEWAFRYVGLPHSMFMTENTLCLEEYLDLLEGYTYDGTHLVEKDVLGREYEIYYVNIDPNETAETVELPVPRTLRYTVSGNNRHGFIVTVELPHRETSWDTTVTTEETGTSDSSAAETTQP